MRAALVSAVVLALVGCDGEQGWRFRNGAGVPEAAPARIVAEVFDGAECGFQCRPRGLRRYCHELVAGAPGPAPTELEGGARYCFMGTALDEDGEAFAVGCAVAEAGGEDVEIVLSAIDEGRFIARQCDTRPLVTLDAGPGLDAGPRDGGRPAVDGGPDDAGLPPARDAGPPRTDAGLPEGSSVSVTFEVDPGGGLYMTELLGGDPVGSQPLRDPVTRIVDAWVGFPVRVEAVPDAGRRFVRFEGGPCGTTTPCDFTFDRTETIRAVFE